MKNDAPSMFTYNVITVHDMNACIIMCDYVSNNYNTVSNDITNVINKLNSSQYHHINIIKNIIKQIGLNDSDPGAYEAVKNLLEMYKKDAVELNLRVGFLPTNHLLSKIFLLFMDIIKDKYLINVIIDQEISGGCQLDYKGYYYNLSLDKFVSDYFDRNSNKLELP